jgi:hypothetical protein
MIPIEKYADTLMADTGGDESKEAAIALRDSSAKVTGRPRSARTRSLASRIRNTTLNWLKNLGLSCRRRATASWASSAELRARADR